jgi:ABC-type antimicrobial peptide transport system permease subunit
VVAVGGAGLVEAAIKALTKLGVSGSIVRITPGVLGYAVLGAVILGFFGGLYPAWRASSMRPVEAIREGAA